MYRGSGGDGGVFVGCLNGAIEGAQCEEWCDVWIDCYGSVAFY